MLNDEGRALLLVVYGSPSRASVLSGRVPPHVETWLTNFQISNPADTESGWAGIPRSMTGIAAMLKQANYSTHAVGKWCVDIAFLELRAHMTLCPPPHIYLGCP